MAFLANLVGIQNIQRFIPLADAAKEGAASTTAPTLEARPSSSRSPTRTRPAADESTREMPRLKPQQPPPAWLRHSRAHPLSLLQKRRQRNRQHLLPPVAKSAAKAAAIKAVPEPEAKAVTVDMKAKIIADAIRLLKWGKPWHELAELIGRIAERPPVPEIRKILACTQVRHRSESRAGESSHAPKKRPGILR